MSARGIKLEYYCTCVEMAETEMAAQGIWVTGKQRVRRTFLEHLLKEAKRKCQGKRRKTGNRWLILTKKDNSSRT